MSIFHNLSEIKDVYCGDTKIESIYLGTEQVYTGETCPYTPDQVIFEQSTAGTYSLDILADGQYEVYCIGGGAGGVKYTGGGRMFCASGGSGAGFIGIIEIVKNTYTITVGVGGTKNTSTSSSVGGGGNSSISSLVIAYAAGNHDANTAGPAGAIPTINTTIISQTLNRAGNKGSTSSGSTCSGGVSVYSNYGKGGNSGLQSAITNGTAGYVKIIYKRK